MDATLWIIAYSKYSKACDQLFDMIQELNINTPFQFLDVDNKNLRKRIKSTQNFSIEYVPCIISINSVGIASQYEGQKAFEIVKRMHIQSLPPRVQQHTEVIPEIQKQDPIQTQIGEFTQSVTPIENLMDEPKIPVIEPGKSSAIKGGKISVNQIMNNAPKEEPKSENHITTIEQKKSGPTISVAEIMSQYNK
jgi:hypothetical protein